jgi:hypothetical protein
MASADLMGPSYDAPVEQCYVSAAMRACAPTGALRGLVVGLTGLAALAGNQAARAQGLLMTSAEGSAFVNRVLAPPSAREVEAALGPAALVLRAKEHLDFGRYRVASLDASECVVQRAASRGMSVGDLFTDPAFGPGGALAIVIDGERLRELDRIFDLHALFPITGTTVDGAPIHMLFLLAGNGHLVIGYDRAGEIEQREPAYHLYGGHYQLAPIIRMDVEIGARRAFTHIAALSQLDAGASYQDFVGPVGSKLRAMFMTPSGVAVHAKMPWWLLGVSRDLRVRPPPIVRRSPITAARTGVLRARGCPVDSPWSR